MSKAAMTVNGVQVLVCSCEDTMPLDGEQLAAALGVGQGGKPCRHLCRTQLDVYRAALATEAPLLVACAQEAPLFTELAEEAGAATPIFVDIRDRAGWSAQGAQATAKMAALIAEALVPLTPTPSIPLTSAGQVLVLGEDETALAVAARLGAERGVICLLTAVAGDMVPPSARPFAVLKGRIARASGRLGAFIVDAEDVAGLAVSARGEMRFDPPGPARPLEADVLLDLRRGAPPLWGARDGYLRCDPGSPLAVEKAVAEALSLMGEFEKPRYARFVADLCAHSRNHKVACTRCIDVCPTAAIVPDGDHVRVDAAICAGHGACASACPTGAMNYDYPAGDGLYERLRVLLRTYAAGKGVRPVLLAYEQGKGDETLSALARFGDGLPAHVLPFAVNAVAGLGLDFLLTAYAYGVCGFIALGDPARDADLAPLRAAAEVADAVSVGLGWGPRAVVLRGDSPDELTAALAQDFPAPVAPAATHLVMGGKRNTQALALGHLRRAAPTPQDAVALPPGAPFGDVALDSDKCTLCQSCISVCPTGALTGSPDKPSLGFTEASCVQCGLCRVTCPEKVITLAPRLNLTDEAQRRVVKKEEEPHCCPRCGKAFGTKASITMLLGKLSKHPMFADGKRLELIQMCDDCRVVVQYEQEEESRPFRLGAPRVPRTTDDYIREREDAERMAAQAGVTPTKKD
jgi:ferredoxin